MTTPADVMAFISSGSATKSCSFLEKGTSYEGPITSMAIRQDSDLQSGELKTWPDGSPKNVLVIGIQTDEVDPDDDDDDGVRTLWAKFKMLDAIRAALKEAGKGVQLEVGGVLSVTFTKQDKPAKRGFSGVKHYEATYEAPDPVADFIEDADENEAPEPKRKAKAAAKPAAKRSKPAPVEDDDDDDYEDDVPAPAPKKRSKFVLVEDDDDDDEPPFEPRRRAKPAAKAAPGKRRRPAAAEDDEDEAF